MNNSYQIFFDDLRKNRNVLVRLVSQNLILRYRRTALGYMWTLINPLLMMSVMAVVFSSLFKAEFRTFSVFLFAGMIPWNFFSSLVSQSGSAFINNEGLIKKVYIPKFIFPLSIAISLLIDSVLSFFALLVIILLAGAPISWAYAFIPAAFALLFVFSLGIGLVMSIATVFFRDLQYITLIAMQGVFFLTPILYKAESLNGQIAILVNFNPVVPFVELFRAPLSNGVFPSSLVVMKAVILALLSFVIGMYVFLSQEKKIVFRL